MVFSALALPAVQPIQAASTDLAGPTGSGMFGIGVTVLPNGNFVVTDPEFSPGSQVKIGAVYLFDGSSHALISQMTGSADNDMVGSGGVKVLLDGSFVVTSSRWSNAGASQAGAVTWCSATLGCPVSVTAVNSLVGGAADDVVGTGSVDLTQITDYNNITPVSGSAYLVGSTGWHSHQGALTYCASGSNPNCLGAVSSSNSLVGASTDDYIGQTVTLVPGQGYIASNASWHNGASQYAGAVALCPVSGSTGCTGVVSTSNSLYGTQYSDGVGGAIMLLKNGDFVVESMSWGGGSTQNGAVTYCASLTDPKCIGKPVTAANSLTATIDNSIVGGSGVTALDNGDYIVKSSSFRLDASTRTGAVTFCTVSSGTSSCTNQVISPSNSLIGDTNQDSVGSFVGLLPGGAFLVSSAQWHNWTGALTYCSSEAACKGHVVSSANSLVGGNAGVSWQDSNGGDSIGSVQILSNGDYLAISPNWDPVGTDKNIGAVTFCPASGCVGFVSTATSLTGTQTGDQVGTGGAMELPGGALLISSPFWANGAHAQAGAVTFCASAADCKGKTVTLANSLVGDQDTIQIGYYTNTILSNGAYLVGSPNWNNGSAATAGALTWCPPTGCLGMVVGAENSLVGSHYYDYVGYGYELGDGFYVSQNPGWQNGSLEGAGAVTLCAITAGCTGPITSANSVLGSVQGIDYYGSKYSYNTYQYDSTHKQLLVGLPVENKVVFFTLSPTAVTNPASSITSYSATLNGTVNALNLSTTVSFDFGPTASYGTSIPTDQSPLSGSLDAAVSKVVSGLAAGATYHYRVVASNTNGTTTGLDQTFTTSAAPPTATTGSASAVSSSGATLNGTVNASGSSTAVTFEYGLTTGYGSSVTATQSPATASSDTPVSKAISGLSPATLYHFRVVAVSAGGTMHGLDQTFTTNPLGPGATTGSASSITAGGATLNGTVNALGTSADVSFVYGLTTGYGSSVTAAESPVTGSSDTPVSKAISGLTPNTVYHFRVVGVNTNGTTNGLDQTFTTAAIAPTAQTNAASSVTSNGATLNGTVNANYASTAVTFEYGADTSYGTILPADQSQLTGSTDKAVSATVSGLTPNATYHYRVAAASLGGTAHGLDGTFMTPKASASIVMGNLSQGYAGSPRAASVTTTPDGLPVAVTYTGVGGTIYATSSTPPTKAGSYTVTANIDNDPTYTGSATDGLTITPRTLTVCATGADKPYDGTRTASVNLSSDKLSGDDVSLSYASATFNSKDVGPGKPISVTGIAISGPDSANYTSSTSASTTAAITAIPLSVTAIGVSKIYDGTRTASVTLSTDKLSGDVVTTGYTSALFDDAAVGTDRPISVSGITIGGADAGNYSLSKTTASATADITPYGSSTALAASSPASTYLEPVTFSATVTPSEATGQVTFKDNGSNMAGCVSLELTIGNVDCVTDALPPSGTAHSITAVYSGDSNYASSTSAAVTHTVDRAATTLQITTSPDPIVYGQTLHVDVSVTSGVLLPNGSVILTVDSSPAQTSSLASGHAIFSVNDLAAGPHTLHAAYNGATNFAPSYHDQVQNIGKANTAVTLTGLTAVYTGKTHPVTVTTVPADLAVKVTYAGVETAPSTVGSYVVVADVLDPNYNGQGSGSLQIAPARLKITADDKSRRVGEANPAFTFSLSGFVNGESLPTSGISGSPLLASLADLNSPIGLYPINPTVGSLSSQNYAFQFVKGTLSVHTPPSVKHPIPDLLVVPAQPFVYSVAPNTFEDIDLGDVLTYAAQKADGSALPAWLAFSPTTRTFTGVPPAAEVIQIKVQAVDRYNDPASAGFKIEVSTPPVQNHSPVAVDDAITTPADTPRTVNLLANDSDPDGDALSLTSIGIPAHGTLQIGSGGQVTYLPDPLFSGVETVVYILSDGRGGTAQAVLTITTTAVTASDIGVDDAATTLQDNPVTIPVLENDVFGAGSPPGNLTIQDQPEHGTIHVNPDQTVLYQPGAGFSGIDSFTYVLGGAAGQGLTAQTDGSLVRVTVVVGKVADDAVAAEDAAVTQENLPVDVDVLVNDSVASGSATLLGIQQTPAHGQVTINPDHTVRYTPNRYFHGTDSFTYSMGNAGQGFDTTQVTVTVQAVNQAPVAVGDHAVGAPGSPVSIDVLANDSDVEDAHLQVTAVTQGEHGQVEIAAGGGSVVYTPADGFSGEDRFIYTITDSGGAVNFAQVMVLIQSAPNLPAKYYFPWVANLPSKYYFPWMANSTSATVVFQQDFSAPVGSEWSDNPRATSPSGEKFLGEFGNGPLNLNLAGLPAHTRVQVYFDLYVLRTWDGNQSIVGPDEWLLKQDGNRANSS
jgi:phosphodiesterase/alkaline phosphatase D-like protein